MKKLSIVIILSVYFSCKPEYSFTDEYMSNYQDIYLKKIHFPENMPNKEYYENNDKFIMVCTGYSDCSSCIIQMKECQMFLSNNKELKDSIEVLFILSGTDIEYLTYQLKKNNFSFYIFYDKYPEFIIQNNLENYDKTVLLLNKNHEIIMVGTPFNNNIIEKYYKQLIFHNI